MCRNRLVILQIPCPTLAVGLREAGVDKQVGAVLTRLEAVGDGCLMESFQPGQLGLNTLRIEHAGVDDVVVRTVRHVVARILFVAVHQVVDERVALLADVLDIVQFLAQVGHLVHIGLVGSHVSRDSLGNGRNPSQGSQDLFPCRSIPGSIEDSLILFLQVSTADERLKVILRR